MGIVKPENIKSTSAGLREGFLSRGVTKACLNAVENVPEASETLNHV